MNSSRLSQFLSTVLVVCSLSLAGAFAGAQEVRATLNGHIEDSNHAAVPNANVTARQNATGVATTVQSDGIGNYTIPFLPPGTYTITVEAQGFKTETRNNVELHVGDKLTVDMPLSLGAVSETVTVTAEPPLLDEGSATRGGLIDNAKITELPIIARNPMNLANLVPGVVFNGNQSFQRPFDNGDVINYSVNGGLRQTNSFLIDGAPDDAYSDTAGDRSHANLNVAYIPSAEVTQEFKVVSNFYDAQYGRTGGGIFNVGTKVGTNNFHGAGYYFFHRYWTDANNVGNKFGNRPVYSIDPVTKQFLAAPKLDQFGGEVGGPVWKDKTFFLFGIEQYNEDTPSPNLVGTITDAERSGDFSKAGVNIYDPYTTRLDSTGHCCIRDQFPGNIIPASRLNGAGYLLAQAFPKPTSPTNTSAANYNTGANLSIDRYRTWIARVDQNFGQKERIYGRFAHARRNQTDQGNTNYPLPLLDSQDPLARINDNAVIDSLTQVTPRMTVDLRASYTRYNETVARSRSASVDVTKYGFSSGYAGSRFVPVFPKLGFEVANGVNLPGGAGQNPGAANSGLTGTGIGSRDPRFGISNTIGFQPSVEYLLGRHTLHLGADIRDFDYNTGGGSFVLGQGGFNFTRNQTQLDPNANASSTQGSPIASLLLGFPNNGIIQYTPNLGYRWRYWAIYLQDDIKVTNRLTVNAGIRYDVEGSPHEIQNRQNRGFAYNTASPLASAAASASANCPACASLKGGLLFAGTGGQPTSAFNTEYNHVQPRIGAVYRAAPNMIFRGGYGLFYLPESAFGAAQGFAQDTAMIPTNAIAAGATAADAFRPRGNNPAAQPLNDPFATGVLQPTGSASGLATFEGQGIIFNNVNRKIPHVHQYSFGMEQQFPYGVKVDASYVGSRTVNVNTNDNQAGGARNLNVLSAA
ncbi:MAG TPA: TonB-dependent receptor, partial [Acidobacteriaceae bacterium]|nr:TonB-dependent receptor [Acidobacteriaceae bacterium]